MKLSPSTARSRARHPSALSLAIPATRVARPSSAPSSPSAGRFSPLPARARRNVGGAISRVVGPAPKLMEVLHSDEKLDALLAAIDEQERSLASLLQKVTATFRALNQPKPSEPLVELEVCLDVIRSHMTHLKQLLECLERLHGRVIPWKGIVPDVPPAKLIETIGAPYHLLRQLVPILNLLPLLPADPPFAPYASLERIHKEDVDAITTVKRWRLGFEFDRYLSDYCHKLDAVYCAVADSMAYTGVRKQISFSSSIIRYSLAVNDAAERADQLRTALSMELLRGVWSIVEDPFLRYFAIKFGYFPDEPVLVDKDVVITLDALPATSDEALGSSQRNASHLRTPSAGAGDLNTSLRKTSLGSEPNLAEFLHAALAPPPPPTPLSSLKLRLMSTHQLTQSNSIFCAPAPPVESAGGFSLLRSLSFPSFAMPDLSFWKRSPNGQAQHGMHTLGPALNCDSSVILHFHGGGWVSQTPETHIVYLRGWAQDLGVPVLSVNYSLAPESPFPHALDQCYAAYKWLLHNPDKLGLSRDAPLHIYIAGDSAGGNIAAAVVVRALREKIAPPAGLLLIYPALFLGEVASISRLLFINDPILTFATCNLCNNAYLPANLRPAAYYNSEVSPGSAAPEILAEWPRTHFLVGDIDPMLDDTLYFASKLKKAGRETVIKLFYNLPHGFMNVADQVPASVTAMREAVRSLYALMEAAQRK